MADEMDIVLAARGPESPRRLRLGATGVTFERSGDDARAFAYESIEAVLLSVNGVLSLQVGDTILEIKVSRGNPEHREFIDTLVRRLSDTLARTAPAGPDAGAAPSSGG